MKLLKRNLFRAILIFFISIVALLTILYRNNFLTNKNDPISIWCIYVISPHEKDLTKFQLKFFKFTSSLLQYSKEWSIHINVIVNDINRKNILNIFDILSTKYQKKFLFTLHSYDKFIMKIQDYIEILKPHFSTKITTDYYNQDLFYISIGLFRFAPKEYNNVILIDIDVKLLDDISILYQQFSFFKEEQLFGLAYEQSPVYRHILTKYRKMNPDTVLGEYIHDNKISQKHDYPNGFPGFNSGVILMQLHKIRLSEHYQNLLSKNIINNLVKKYQFQGHLGDQDFYTLIAFEYPNLFYHLPCKFNRQLCTWWNSTLYHDLFDFYHRCKQKTLVLHANCNSFF